MRHIDHARPRLCGELAQDKRHHNESSRRTLWPGIKCSRMEMRREAMCNESAPRALEAILARIIGARVATRRKQHGPKSDPGTKFHNATLVWQRIEPEHRAIKFSLPGCAAKWPAIVWGTIQVPRLEFVGVLWRWQESESCRYAALPNFRGTNSQRR
ncbi:MAG: hypothetical protein RLZZ460_723 [Chloroflexota bacterium]